MSQLWLEKRRGETEFDRRRAGVLTPSSVDSRNRLQHIIQKELALGIFDRESKRYLLEEIESLFRRGAQGIVLGCTEFPLVVTQDALDIPCFDTTWLHAQMAVDFILG